MVMATDHAKPYAGRVPMVAMVIGAASPIGQRVVASLALHGARLALVGDTVEKELMEQMGREATCLGCPSCDIHELDMASISTPGGGGESSQAGPPVETMHMVVQTVLSRQGRVDIIVSCPHGDSPAAWELQNQQQYAAAHMAASLLATALLAPPTPSDRAIVAVTPNSNKDMSSWARGWEEFLAAAATDNKIGMTGPTAEGLSDQERAAAAKEVFLLHVMLHTGLEAGQEEHVDMHDLSSRVSQAIVQALAVWRSQSEGFEPPDNHQSVLIAAHPHDDPSPVPSTGATDLKQHSQPQQQQQHTPQVQQHSQRKGLAGVHQKDPANLTRGFAEVETAGGGGAEQAAASSEVAHTHDLDPGSSTSAASTQAAMKAGIDLATLSLAASSDASASGSTSSADTDSSCKTMRVFNQEDEQILLQQVKAMLGPTGAKGGQQVPGRDPAPRPGATCIARHPSKAVWIKSHTPPVSGLLLATGARAPPGLLSRHRCQDQELLKAASAIPGAVLTPADPNNLEPDASKAYQVDPQRHPSYLVHCFKPFNGETPHQLLADEFLTPPELFYVRNHLPVPTDLKAEGYSFELSGIGMAEAPFAISLAELKAGKWGRVVHRQATLQCAGNRRAEMAAVRLVEGRAPWNHGSIGNAEWTAVELRDVLLKAGLDQTDPEGPQHVIMEAWDCHHLSGTHFETSIPLFKVMDERGGVMLAWQMNGVDLLPDHGYPLRVVVPGYVGTRSVKWIKRIVVAAKESSSAWQQKDYKILPQRFTTLGQAISEGGFALMPPIMAMPVQSAILLPEPGSVIKGKCIEAVWFKGYAWCGDGLPITRVDVSSDAGATWETAEITERERIAEREGVALPQTGSKAWSWVKWQIPLQVPEALRLQGGKWRVCCKAFNINCDSQPGTTTSIWNFRGLACNSWHFVDIAVLPAKK